jgi:peptidyl-prolyl cis-trans isomerase A (cyclophilin A)
VRRFAKPLKRLKRSAAAVTEDEGRGPCEDRGVTKDNGRQIVAEQLYATLKTNHGDIEVRLLPNHAPKTVRNFVELAKGEREWTNPATGAKSTDKLYDGTVFHRVISGFMIQGGDPLGNGTGGPGYEFEDEFHPDLGFDKPYLLAMANAGPGTNGSQFFITVSPTAWLTRKHTIFGEVSDGASQKVVDAIASAQTNPRTDRPVSDVVIESVVIETR